MGTDKYKYVQIADQIEALIANKALAAHSRLPGTRNLAKRYSVSINTILQAQKRLEFKGLIRAVERSGFYVCPDATRDFVEAEHKPIRPSISPQLVFNQQLVMDLISAAHSDDTVALGTALPHESFLPSEQLRTCLARAARKQPALLTRYSFPPGDDSFRDVLCQKMRLEGLDCNKDDIVITSGCHDALLLSLQVLAKPGDIIAVESPCYYGLLQALDSLSLRVLEIPSTPQGLHPGALEAACQRWKVSACILVSNFSNPTGSLMGVEAKLALLDLLDRYNVPLIEDDIYGDLSFSGERPPALASLASPDTSLIYCSSFSKTVSPGLRIGWAYSKQHSEKINHLKFAQSLGTAPLAQAALVEFFERGYYYSHIRRIQKSFATQVHQSINLIRSVFPTGITVVTPKGGFVLWVKLPDNADTYELYKMAGNEGVSLAPGIAFSVRNNFSQYFRLNCAQPWAQLNKAIKQLGKLTHRIVNA